MVLYLLGSYVLVIPVTKPLFQSFFQDKLSDVLSKDVIIEDIDGTFFSSIFLSNVKIQNSDDYHQSSFADVKHVIFDVSLFHFLIKGQLLKKLH